MSPIVPVRQPLSWLMSVAPPQPKYPDEPSLFLSHTHWTHVTLCTVPVRQTLSWLMSIAPPPPKDPDEPIYEVIMDTMKYARKYYSPCQLISNYELFSNITVPTVTLFEEY